MGEVPRSLTELKIQIGKNILAYGMKSVFGSDDRHQAVIDRAPGYHHIEAAELWRSVYLQVVQKVGWAAERALLELPHGRDAAMASLMMDTLKMETDVSGAADSGAAMYLYPILRDVFSVDDAGTSQCLEALVAYGRGE